ncbi:MAG: zf-TFIIB domain-containing protein [Candidatus Thorarchaeota archaeon]
MTYYDETGVKYLSSWIYGHFLIERENFKKWLLVFLLANIIGSTIPYLGIAIATITGFVLGPLAALAICFVGCSIGIFAKYTVVYGVVIFSLYIVLMESIGNSFMAVTISILTRKTDPSSTRIDCIRTIVMLFLLQVRHYIAIIPVALIIPISTSFIFDIFNADPIYLMTELTLLCIALAIGPRIRAMILGPIVSPFSRPTGRTSSSMSRIIRPQKLVIEPTTAFPTYESPQSTITEQSVEVKSGVDTAGEYLKVGIKIQNNGELAITGVTVTFDAPEGLDYAKGSTATLRLGSVSPGGFQSAIFWLKPLRCIDDSFGGLVIFRDARDVSHQIEIPRKRLVNICPMLEGTDSPREIFAECKYGGLQRNSSAFKFAGAPEVVFSYANARVASLVPVDKTQQNVGVDNYLAYTCVVGKTKYADKKFAAEIQVSGNPAGGILTLNVYSDDERILSGFFVDIMSDVRQHVQILEENNKIRPTNCPNCNAPLNLSTIDETRIYQCESCGSRGKVPPWLI